MTKLLTEDIDNWLKKLQSVLNELQSVLNEFPLEDDSTHPLMLVVTDYQELTLLDSYHLYKDYSLNYLKNKDDVDISLCHLLQKYPDAILGKIQTPVGLNPVQEDCSWLYR